MWINAITLAFFTGATPFSLLRVIWDAEEWKFLDAAPLAGPVSSPPRRRERVE
jgi:hypothetical protein